MPEPLMPHHTAAELENWFPSERQPDPGTFEIALVLAGAVSAGAYTAGVLDFLYEALDAWHLERARELDAGVPPEQRQVPHHDVVLRIITGASAGGMNGAISAAALRYRFPHPQGEGKAADPGDYARENPFYLAWVREIDLRPLLETDDLNDPIFSILNSSKLVEIVRQVVEFRGQPVEDKRMRAWLRNPLPVLLTVTNLRGVPYQIVFRGGGPLRHEMSMHRDHVVFAAGGLSPRPAQALPPDVRLLTEEASFSDPLWHEFGMSALATGAFPLFLSARRLSREGSHYLYRNASRNDAEVGFDQPSSPGEGTPAPYDFLCVDGGTMNNEPYDLAHMALAGLTGRSPREGDRADRALIMIDPFADPGELGPAEPCSLFSLAGAVVRSMVNQARFSPRDRALIQNESIYSRYLVAPSRSGFVGSKSLASGGLGAFFGFFSEAYRHHDFMLGRRNCQRFLQSVLTLPQGNPIFAGWSQRARAAFCDPTDATHLQVIPLTGKCAVEEKLPRWPARDFKRDGKLTDLIEKRVDGVLDRIRKDAVLGDSDGLARFGRRAASALLFGPAMLLIKRQIKKATCETIDEAAKQVENAR
jgi:hypothetical protein